MFFILNVEEFSRVYILNVGSHGQRIKLNSRSDNFAVYFLPR